MMADSKSNNPANQPEKRVTERGRIPMSIPMQKLATPPIEGYFTHWFVGTPARISQALRAGFEFVDGDEVELQECGIADLNQNSDMGSRVSIVSGNDPTASAGENELVLMKLRQEYRDDDLAKMAERNEAVAAALRGDHFDNEDGQSYIPKAHRNQMSNMFKPKR